MKRNGFTLIELLAVIVVLAIIALIATPIVLNIINNAKTSSNERSGELYIKSVENAIMKKQMNGTDVVEDGKYTVQSDGSICIVSNNACESGTTITIDVEGDLPESGTLTVSNGVVVSYNLVVSGTSIVKVDSTDEEDDNEDENQNSCLVGESYGISIYLIESKNKVYFNMSDTWYYSELRDTHTLKDKEENVIYDSLYIHFKEKFNDFDEEKTLSIYETLGSMHIYFYDSIWYYETDADDIVSFDTCEIDTSFTIDALEFQAI